MTQVSEARIQTMAAWIHSRVDKIVEARREKDRTFLEEREEDLRWDLERALAEGLQRWCPMPLGEK